jgi:DNA-binding CsgD family transcriptional regulator
VAFKNPPEKPADSFALSISGGVPECAQKCLTGTEQGGELRRELRRNEDPLSPWTGAPSLTPRQRRTLILASAAAGDNVPTIAAKARCSVPTVYRILELAGVTTHLRNRKGGGRLVRITAAMLARVEGMGVREAGAALGYSREGVRMARARRAAGVGMAVGAGEVGHG